MLKDDYCDYDTCVALKELGCSYLSNDKVYVGKGGLYCKCTPPYNSQKYNEGELLSPFYILGCHKEVGTTIPAIPLYEAQKWLREEKNIHIEIYACAGGYIYELCKAYKPNSFSGGTTIYTPNDVDNPKLNDAGRYDSFEEALSEGVREAVKILKK